MVRTDFKQHSGELRFDFLFHRDNDFSFTYQAFPVRSIYGHGMNLDEYLIVRRDRFRYLFELKNVRSTVFCVNNGFHMGILRCAATCSFVNRYGLSFNFKYDPADPHTPNG